MNSDQSSFYIMLGLIAILIVFYGFNTACAIAMDKASKSKIKNSAEEEKHKNFELALALMEKPLKYIFPLKLINLIIVIGGTAYIWVIGYMPYAITGFFVAVLILFGELFPWKVALQHREGITLKWAKYIKLISILTLPVFLLAKFIVNIFLAAFRQSTEVNDGAFSEEEVMSMLDEGKKSGVLKEEGHKMINSIFNFDDELAYEIMTPRTDVFAIDIAEPVSTYIDKLMEMKYSRIPVYEDDYDNIIGILHIKDFLIKARESGFDKVDIKAILRKPYFVPDTKNIDALFLELQKGKQHIAVLIDEYGGFSGIVTVEDIIEEIVGDIDDEFDEEAHVIEKIDDANYTVDGNVSLSDLSGETNINLTSESSETIGGFIIDILGEIPDENAINKRVEYENYVFTILSVKDRRIEKVLVHVEPANPADEHPEEN